MYIYLFNGYIIPFMLELRKQKKHRGGPVFFLLEIYFLFLFVFNHDHLSLNLLDNINNYGYGNQ